MNKMNRRDRLQVAGVVLAVSSAVAGAAIIGNGNVYSNVRTVSCSSVVPNSDSNPDGIRFEQWHSGTDLDYRHGQWIDPDGAILGYSRTEDGPIFEHEGCS